MEKLKLRAEIKKKKPKFVRQNTLLKKISKKWRKPKGLQSKLRLSRAGHMKTPSQGYRSPLEVRGLDPNGLKPVLIYKVPDLEKINTEKESIIISRKVGLRKKLEILRKAQESKLTISNVPNIEEFIKKSEDGLTKRKEASKKRKEKKQKARKETEKKSKEEKKPEEKPETKEEHKPETKKAEDKK